MFAEFFHDPANWVTISFIGFALLFARYGWAGVAAKLDGRIDEIRTQLDEAEKLRLEAEAMLVDYQQRHAQAMKEAEEIAAHARAHAKDARAKAEAELAENMARRERQMEERLKRMQEAAEAELRRATAALALKAAQDLVLKSLDKDAQARLIDRSIADIPAALN